MRFHDRKEGGAHLARAIQEAPSIIVCRDGGASEVADALADHWDVPMFVLRDRPARTAREQRDIHHAGLLRQIGIGDDALESLMAHRQAEGRRGHPASRRQPLPDVAGQDVLIVDDGLGTAAELEHSASRLRAAGARRVRIAAPAASQELQALDGLVYVRARPDEGPDADVYVRPADRDRQLAIRQARRNGRRPPASQL